MPAAIFSTPVQVDGRLHALKISKAHLIEVIEAMVAAKAECTDNDPPSAPGWSSWRHGTRRAREVFRPDGWLKDDTDQLSTIVNHSLGMRIAVANTDDATGIDSPLVCPQNRSKKGAATDRAIDLTQQSLFGPDRSDDDPVVVPFQPRERHSAQYATYYLCVFNEGDDVRAELSCPIQVTNGFFSGLNERIIIVGPAGWPPEPARKRDDGDDGSGSEFNIPVRRK